MKNQCTKKFFIIGKCPVEDEMRLVILIRIRIVITAMMKRIILHS